jgi:hypothetical protein
MLFKAKKQDSGLEKTLFIKVRGGCLLSSSVHWSPQRPCAGNEPMKKTWELAERDVYFQS